MRAEIPPPVLSPGSPQCCPKDAPIAGRKMLAGRFYFWDFPANRSAATLAPPYVATLADADGLQRGNSHASESESVLSLAFP
ncbi:hypothetical protein Q31a_58010 [Aureliella helgolandensis]|uniref:Uncharacterized protein n=1 Tax=Aureliella helgolandensis TaxID=2527968 RepID=A0A518GFN9_9BACT|nr:hypothetical protein Q31a_58010 [Aureliella helgolandensis]